MRFKPLFALLALASVFISATPFPPFPINGTNFTAPPTTNNIACIIFIKHYQKCAPTNGDLFPTWERYNGFVVPAGKIQDSTGKTTEPWRGRQQESGWRNSKRFKWLIHGLAKDTGLEYGKNDNLHMSYPNCFWETDSKQGCGQCMQDSWDGPEPKCVNPVSYRERHIYCHRKSPRTTSQKPAHLGSGLREQYRSIPALADRIVKCNLQFKLRPGVSLRPLSSLDVDDFQVTQSVPDIRWVEVSHSDPVDGKPSCRVLIDCLLPALDGKFQFCKEHKAFLLERFSEQEVQEHMDAQLHDLRAIVDGTFVHHVFIVDFEFHSLVSPYHFVPFQIYVGLNTWEEVLGACYPHLGYTEQARKKTKAYRLNMPPNYDRKIPSLTLSQAIKRVQDIFAGFKKEQEEKNIQ
ncbi:hypothetical protein BDV96DRAFT_643737 [Lophiotrema nucula]|uniref:Uncharacterized protein n=1 Tax=Lophiotrema nucula TaxID=690887 RepID=A0A6A5ZG78_9PLEO|nr:hypothetical protein BDV96DRAFT_643737 [Lophiotrema nucula]